jgi:hypothetical protein
MLFLLNFIFIFTLSANDNPLSLEFKTSKEDFGGELKNVLIVDLESKALDSKDYLLIVYPPKNVEVIEGKRSYKEKIEPLKTKKHKITFDILEEGPFKVKARLYLLNDNGYAILETQRLFVSKGEFKKEGESLNYFVTIEETREVEISDIEKEEKKEIIVEEIKEENNKDSDYTSNIVIDMKKDENNFLKYIFFLISLAIVSFLVYLLKKNKN